MHSADQVSYCRRRLSHAFKAQHDRHDPMSADGGVACRQTSLCRLRFGDILERGDLVTGGLRHDADSPRSRFADFPKQVQPLLMERGDRRPVGDRDQRRVRQPLFQNLVQFHLCFGIHAGGGLIQEDPVGLRQQRPGEAQSLLLPIDSRIGQLSSYPAATKLRQPDIAQYLRHIIRAERIHAFG